MFFLDTPDALPPTVAVVTKADTIKTSKEEPVVRICYPVQYVAPGEQPGSRAGSSSPDSWTKVDSPANEKSTMERLLIKSVEILKKPRNGTLVFPMNSKNGKLLQYIPQPGYAGTDRIEYRVGIVGKQVRLIYFIHVTKKNLHDPKTPLFCKGRNWKTSQSEVLDLM